MSPMSASSARRLFRCRCAYAALYVQPSVLGGVPMCCCEVLSSFEV